MIKIQAILDKQKEIDYIQNQLEIEISSFLEQFSCLNLDFDELYNGDHSLYSIEGITLKNFPSSLDFDYIYQMVLRNDPRLLDEEFDNDEDSILLAKTLIRNNIDPETLYDFVLLAGMIDFPSNAIELAKV